MSKVHIYRPAKTAMQSGFAKTHHWVLEHEPSPKDHDPLMGWVGSSDTKNQVLLRFASKEEAIAFAEKKGLDFEVAEPHDRHIRPKSYADNFRYQRLR